jgi:hypothetical protein
VKTGYGIKPSVESFADRVDFMESPPRTYRRDARDEWAEGIHEDLKMW